MGRNMSNRDAMAIRVTTSECKASACDEWPNTDAGSVLFDEVSSVIGHEDAVKQLRIAKYSQANRYNNKYTLSQAFTWSLTKQGYKYWQYIDKRI